VLRSPFTDVMDRKTIGVDVRDRWEKGSHLAVRFRQHREVLSGRVFDIMYLDFIRDPIGVIRSLYEHFEMHLTNAAEEAMLRFLPENPQHKHGVHRYALKDYGLDPVTERRRFQFYMDYFRLGTE